MADTHLRDAQYASRSRGRDFASAFLAAAEAAAQAADMAVLVGDIFDKARPSPGVIATLMQAHSIFARSGKPCLAVTGNHDWSSPTWIDTLFSGNLEGADIPAGKGGIYPIDGKSVSCLGYRFAGLPPLDGEQFRANLADMTVRARGADVVLYHGLVCGIVPIRVSASDPFHVRELPVDQANLAWLLGDIHIQGYTHLPRPGGGETLVGYPGSTEMCSSSEPPHKSVPIVRLTEGGAEAVDKLPIATRPFIEASVCDEGALDALVEKAKALADQHPLVLVKFARSLPQTIGRLHAVLDPQRAIVRCYPLPADRETRRLDESGLPSDDLGIDHFVAARFPDGSKLQAAALALLARPESADEIVSDFIDDALAAEAVREG